MKPSAACLDFIRKAEGLRLTAYADAVGKRTIGYGHVLRPDEGYSTCTPDEAERLLAFDLADACKGIDNLMGKRQDDLRQHEYDALVSFVFNLGAGNLARSTLLRLLLDGNHALAAREFRRWHYAGGVPLVGLLRRRIAEELMFLGGNMMSVLDVATGPLVKVRT